LAKILTLLVLFEIHIFNKTKTKISKISENFIETNVTAEEEQKGGGGGNKNPKFFRAPPPDRLRTTGTMHNTV